MVIAVMYGKSVEVADSDTLFTAPTPVYKSSASIPKIEFDRDFSDREVGGGTVSS